MGATRAQKQIYFQKLKELVGKYRKSPPILALNPGTR